jgi:hypothetical protein
MWVFISCLIRIAVCTIIGLVGEMSIMGIVLFSIGLLIATEVIGIIGRIISRDLIIEEPVVLIILQCICVAIICISYFLAPNFEERYVPESTVGASLDNTQSIDMRDIDADQPFYLRISVNVKINSWARNLLGKKDIPFTIEVSNPNESKFSEPQNMRFCKEIGSKEEKDGVAIYRFSVLASSKPKTAVIDFTVTPKQAGQQRIKITYDKKVSDVYERTVTLVYNN